MPSPGIPLPGIPCGGIGLLPDASIIGGRCMPMPGAPMPGIPLGRVPDISPIMPCGPLPSIIIMGREPDISCGGGGGKPSGPGPCCARTGRAKADRARVKRVFLIGFVPFFIKVTGALCAARQVAARRKTKTSCLKGGLNVNECLPKRKATPHPWQPTK